MNHPEADYINEGHRFERAQSPDKARAVAQRLRAMLSSERPEDQTEARALIERGRAEALYWAQCATEWGFTVNLSADDAGEADALAEISSAPITCIVPMDTPERTTTPEGRTIIVCPAQTREDVSCATCQLCARADRRIIVGFRAHGSRARVTDAKARRVIPISINKG